MYQIKTLNSISPKGLERLSGNLFAVDAEDALPDGILLRSAAMHEMELPASLLGIARAGAGVNNIPVEQCSEAGIVVFNTPGANANAVKELVLGGLVLSSRNVVKAAEWAKTLKGQGDIRKLVEKGKGQFVGPELSGKKLGVIGLGAIGVKVANMATHLGMSVYGYDPYISIDAAWNLSQNVNHCVNLVDILTQCDYISLHLPVTSETKGFINEQSLAQLKHGARILNFARAELVNSDAMLAALKAGRVATYVVDFPTDEMLNVEGCICIPHLGASTPESEDNCAIMAADQMSDFLIDGNIKNSVNFPEVFLPRCGSNRICVVHKNVPGILAGITDATSKSQLNIENMVNKSKKEYAYTLLDANGSVPDSVTAQLAALPGVIRVRII